MSGVSEDVDMVVQQIGSSSRVIALRDQHGALTEKGIAVALGEKRCARADNALGKAFVFGVGTAFANTAVSLLCAGGVPACRYLTTLICSSWFASGRSSLRPLRRPSCL